MSWAIGYDSNWHRDIGYGVVAYCDHPKCNEVIDRGLSYVCGGDPEGGDRGCGLYFCEKHLQSGVRLPQLCERCRKRRKAFDLKPEHPRWLWWKLNDPSWAEWREENPEEVVKYREQIKGYIPDPDDVKATSWHRCPHCGEEYALGVECDLCNQKEPESTTSTTK